MNIFKRGDGAMLWQVVVPPGVDEVIVPAAPSSFDEAAIFAGDSLDMSIFKCETEAPPPDDFCLRSTTSTFRAHE